MANNVDDTGAGRDDHRGDRRGAGWRIVRWATIATLVAIPWVAMQVTDEVQWTLPDFVFAGALLGAAGLLFELAVWKIRSAAVRAAIGAALAAMVVLIWADAAVGVF